MLKIKKKLSTLDKQLQHISDACNIQSDKSGKQCEEKNCSQQCEQKEKIYKCSGRYNHSLNHVSSV